MMGCQFGPQKLGMDDLMVWASKPSEQGLVVWASKPGVDGFVL
jgi:hypothetical protein